MTKMTAPLSCRSKRLIRPNFLLCCRRWSFLVRRLNTAALAAGRYCAEEATKSHSASPEEQQKCAAP
jgi:hypothetical protein